MKLKNKIFTMLGLSFAFVFGFFTISNIKVDATAFTLADGTTSEITYNEGQILTTGKNFNIAYIQKTSTTTDKFAYMFTTVNQGSNNYIYNATTNKEMTSNTISGTYRFTIHTFSGNNSFNDRQSYNWSLKIYKNYVEFINSSGSATRYDIVPTGASEEEINNARQEGYTEGYQDGLQANQDTIYQNGYNAGYSAGESAGLTTGYNNGYSAGESAGLTTGYNNGVADLGDYVVSELGTAPGSQVNISVSCSGVNNSECLANAKGKISSNIDTLVVNSTNSGYNNGYSAGESAGLTTGYNNGYSAGESAGLTTGYNNGYSAGESAGLTTGYNNGYSVGLSDGENYGLVISSCNVSGLINASSYNCFSNVDVVNGFVSFNDLRHYLDTNDLINGRYNIDLHLKNYISPSVALSFNTYSSTGVYVYFYDNDTLLFTLDLENYSLDSLDYIVLSDYGFNTSYNRIVVSNANFDYSMASFGVISSYSYDTGYDNGYVDGNDSKNNLPGIIGSVISTPINMLSSIFNFEFLGVNLSSFIFSLLSLLVVIWLVKFFF